MQFRTRAFLLCFVPFAALLAASFWMIQRMVQSTVREGLRSSLRENHLAIARIRGKGELQNSRFLRVAGENASLKAGMQLLLLEPGSADARATVEDQLRELCERMGFDFLTVSSPAGAPLAGVLRLGGQISPVDISQVAGNKGGLQLLDGQAVQIASVPIDQGEENLGSLSVGEYFDMSGFSTPVVLFRNGRAILSSLHSASLSEIDRAMNSCGGRSECDIRLNGVTWLSLAMPGTYLGGSFTLRSLQNLDAATRPVQLILQQVFFSVSLFAVALAVVCAVGSSRTIGKPIAAIAAHLRETERTGLLPEFSGEVSRIREVRDLMENFNRAGRSVREARENLQSAYVEFVGSLASALDARDRYTAGHSSRVSQLCCMTAASMELSAPDIERIRLGALLHDIGKIGIPDELLRKPGSLTDEEFAVIKQHPETGRRILEGVHGFSTFLPAVELHHENWDGTGYPHGQCGEETPIEARIIHVADAYDAMTTDRPYRSGMTHERAIRILYANAGTQFDPAVVKAFSSLPWTALAAPVNPRSEYAVMEIS